MVKYLLLCTFFSLGDYVLNLYIFNIVYSVRNKINGSNKYK